MSSVKTQTTKKINWTQFLRPKVGDVVNHIGSDWVSVNGKNSEPSESNSDWSNVMSSNQSLDEVLGVGNTTNVPIIFSGGRFVLNPTLSDFSLDSRVLLIGFNSEQEILTLSSNLTENREQTFQDKNGLIATLEDIQLRKKGVIVHTSGVSVILNESVNVLINDNAAKVQVTIPSPTTNKGREITFTALGEEIELSQNYTDTNGFIGNLILKGFSVTIVSTGARYQLISGIN